MRFKLTIETKEDMEPNQFVQFVLKNLRQTGVEIVKIDKGLGWGGPCVQGNHRVITSRLNLKDDMGNVVGDFEFEW